jgi:hypothetical protein
MGNWEGLSMPGKFRKKPIVIEAVRWDGSNYDEVCEFVGESLSHDAMLIIPTLEGKMEAGCGDWIIKGINNEFYPCKNDIFIKTYEEVLRKQIKDKNDE